MSTMSDRELLFWTVYDHPLDFPEAFVVRAHRVTAGRSEPTDKIFVAPTLEEVRTLVPPGLHRLNRRPDDDPKIVETWI